MDPYIGKFLDDRYEIMDILGTGGMAVVYRAYDHRLNRYVAVKILKSELSSDQDLRRRFHDESQAVAMLSHPNIVSVYDVSQVDNSEYIVMELIAGITLKQYIRKRGGALNWREALHFITQITQGLKHAHSRGIIHRDIKPQNVMVLRDGSVKVTDFGIARSTTSQATVTQEAIGSVHYISPEQARGSHIDTRSDIYSAGVVLYEMLTGRLPYEGDNPVAVALQHINSIPIPPREINPEIPLGLEQITLKAMASVPDRRYVNAEEMLQDLEDFRRNPMIDFGYTAPGAVAVESDEPTMVRKGTAGFSDEEEAAAAAPVIPSRRPVQARFEPDEPEVEDYDDEDDGADEKKGNRKFVILISSLVAALVLVLGLIAFLLLHHPAQEEAVSYTVPNLLGLTVQEAEDLIARDETIAGHFTVNDNQSAESEAPIGTIIEQTPKSDRTSHQETTEISVTISTGPAEEEPVEIVLKDYTNQEYSYVKGDLEDLGLRTRVEMLYDDTVQENKVIRTEPAANSTVLPGDQVTIFCSQGKEDASFSMNKLLGLTEADAKSAISRMGLTLQSVNSEYSSEYAEGRVCYQSIPENTPVEAGTAISITISLGPEPEPQEPEEPTPTEPEEPTEPEPVEPEIPVAQIVITIPAKETDSNVELIINGVSVPLTNGGTVAASEESTKLEYDYEGTVNSIDVYVDGTRLSGSASDTNGTYNVYQQ